MQEGYRAAKYLEIRMPTLSIRREGNTGGCDIASTHWTCEVKDPRHAWNLHAREPGGPTSARHEVVSGPVGEGDEPQSRHERWQGVGRLCSTCEVPEQRWKSLTGGGHGGKTTDQGEHGAGGRVPDAKLGRR